MEKVDKDEFQAWKDSTMTQWVLQRLEAKRAALMESKMDHLFYSAAQPGWAELQPEAAFVQGQCDAFDFFTGLTLEDVQPEDETTE